MCSYYYFYRNNLCKWNYCTHTAVQCNVSEDCGRIWQWTSENMIHICLVVSNFNDILSYTSKFGLCPVHIRWILIKTIILFLFCLYFQSWRFCACANNDIKVFSGYCITGDLFNPKNGLSDNCFYSVDPFLHFIIKTFNTKRTRLWFNILQIHVFPQETQHSLQNPNIKWSCVCSSIIWLQEI